MGRPPFAVLMQEPLQMMVKLVIMTSFILSISKSIQFPFFDGAVKLLQEYQKLNEGWVVSRKFCFGFLLFVCVKF